MRSLRRRGGIGLLLVALLSLAACGNFRERSLCSQYEDFGAAVAQLQDLDPRRRRPTTCGPSPMMSSPSSTSSRLRPTTCTSARSRTCALSITAFRQAAVDLPTTDLDVARPLLQDAWDDVIVDYQVLVQRLDVACNTN